MKSRCYLLKKGKLCQLSKSLSKNILMAMLLIHLALVVVGECNTYEEALTDVKSALQFQIETFGRMPKKPGFYQF
jgi:hypothetical protein